MGGARQPQSPSALPSPGSPSHSTHSTSPRRARRAAETREKIFREALRLFIAQGFAVTTIEQITEAADVGKGTFFNYFPSKEHVLAAFGDMQISKLRDIVAEVRAERLSVRDAFARLPVVLSEEPGRSPFLVRALLTAMLTSAAVRGILTDKLAIGRMFLADLIRIAQRERMFRRDVDARAAARLMQQSVFGAMLFWSFYPTGKLSEAASQAVEMFVAGMESKRR